jgi:hypothetical protein
VYEINKMTISKYIILDSTYRNRTQWPNPFEFVVSNTQSGIAATSFTAVDPIISGFPIGTDSTGTEGGITVSTVNFVNLAGSGASGIANFYIGDVLQATTGAGQEFRIITSYVLDSPAAGDRIANVSPPFTGVPTVGGAWTVRNGFPTSFGNTLQAGSTITTAVLSLAEPATNDIFNGFYIRITSGVANGNVRRINDYVGTTRTATISGIFTAVPGAGDSYEILAFKNDNFSPLIFTGSIASSQQQVCYEVELSRLIIPVRLGPLATPQTLIVAAAQGGPLVDYPFVWVEFSSEANSNSNINYTNNPHATKALFKVPIDDDLVTLAFIKLEPKMVQTIKFRPNDNFKFRVFLPCGETLVYNVADNVSPTPPNPRLQVCATFKIKRIDP